MNKELLLAILMGGASLGASADPLSYTYLDLGLSHVSRDQTEGGSGYEASGSYALADEFFLGADYSHANFGRDTTFGQADIEVMQNRYQLGGGFHYSLGHSADVIGTLAYMHDQAHNQGFAGPFISSSHSGYDLSIGIRAPITAHFEVLSFFDNDSVGLEYHSGIVPCPGGTCQLGATLNAGASENSLVAGLRWHISQQFGLKLMAQHSSIDSANQYCLAAEWSL